MQKWTPFSISFRYFVYNNHLSGLSRNLSLDMIRNSGHFKYNSLLQAERFHFLRHSSPPIGFRVSNYPNFKRSHADVPKFQTYDSKTVRPGKPGRAAQVCYVKTPRLCNLTLAKGVGGRNPLRTSRKRKEIHLGAKGFIRGIGSKSEHSPTKATPQKTDKPKISLESLAPEIPFP